ncbi:hypothetical protein [Streptomyces sp. 4F14]|uniref:hypothetical protein n=1 Tax=Streptomyces sp. 4F14 TaxID=3394380 RepID=UPI003A8516C6
MKENPRAEGGLTPQAGDPGARPSDWQQALAGLPTTWPRSLEEQAADRTVRTAVRDAYLSGVNVAEICRRTRRSPKAVVLMLSREEVLRAAGGHGPRVGLPAGCPTWSAYVTAVVRRRLADGTYPAATPLPSYRVPAAELKVCRSAVCAATRRFKDEGRLRREGRRLVVNGPVRRPALPVANRTQETHPGARTRSRLSGATNPGEGETAGFRGRTP